MRKLNTDINAVIRQFGSANGNFVDSLSRALPIMSVLLTLILTIATVVTGGDDPDQSDSGTGDEPPVVSPVTPVENAQLRTDLQLAINLQRSLKGQLNADFNADLRTSAQAKAMENATAGSLSPQSPGEEKILLLQARQDTAVATADNFINLWAGDEANYNALMHEDNDTMGVGVAETGGVTYAVVQFTQQ